MGNNICPYCQKVNEEEYNFCQECGTELVSNIESKEVGRLKNEDYMPQTVKISFYSEGLEFENKSNGEFSKIPFDKVADMKHSSNKVSIITYDNLKYEFTGLSDKLTMKSDLTKGTYSLSITKISGKLIEKKLPKISDFERRRNKFFDGTAKMLIELPPKTRSGATRVGATLAFGIIGYVATSGKKSKKANVFIRVKDDKISISGDVSSEFKISDIRSTLLSSSLKINFVDGSSIVLAPFGGRTTYPRILNDLIKIRLNNINSQNQKKMQISKGEASSSMDEIKKAKELLDAGAISEKEFDDIKNKLLNKI